MMHAGTAVLLCLVASVQANQPALYQLSTDESITPVQKVVQMLNEMLAKGKAEKEDEVVRFSAYKMFCDKTRAAKTKAIAEENAAIEQLKADIVKAAADAAELADQIAKHSQDIAQWSSEKSKADAVRAKENADYKVVQKDLADALSSVDRAKETIEAQPQSVGQSLLQVQENVQNLATLDRVPQNAKHALMAFLQRSGEDALLQAPEAAAFESHTGGIMDIVEELGDKFSKQKDESEKQEMEKAHGHNMMDQDLIDQIDNAKASSDEKAEAKADREQAGADAKGTLTDTKADLAADTQFLKDLNTECQAKAVDYEKRQVLRAGEITAVSKAIEIMSSPDVAGGTQYLPSSLAQKGAALIQLRSTEGEHRSIQNRVAVFLQSRAQSSGSRVLALVAQRMQADPFKKITKMIQDMVDKLMQEAREEAEHKGFCDTEMGTNQQTRDMKSDEVAELTASSEELTANIEKLASDAAELTAAIADIDAAVAKATMERTEEKTKNTQTIADAQVAAEATGRALTVLQEFYEKAADATALAQEDASAQGDEFQSWHARDAVRQARKTAKLDLAQLGEQVPGAPETFDKPYTGMGGSNTGVVGMLEVIQSDFSRLETETSSAETAAANDYKEFTTASSSTKAVKETNLKHAMSQRAEKEQKLNSVKKDLATTQEELDAALAYYEKLKPSCVDQGISYEDRVARRKEEIESLKEALEILNDKEVA